MTVRTGPVVPDPAERRGGDVARMFDAVAPRYDLLNHLLSFNLDRLWRRAAARALAPEADGVYLDLCTGSGDLALLIARRAGARVVGADFSEGMLRLARRKAARARVPLLLVQADGLALPFRDRSLEGVAIAFGARNFQDLDAGLGESARILKEGGRAVILEFSEPRGRLFGPLYLFYFRKVLPWVGRAVSRRPGAYEYLPASVSVFPTPEEVEDRLRRAGLVALARRRLAFGAVVLYVAQRATPPPGPADLSELRVE